MKPRSEFLLVFSRYITYGLVFISSIVSMEQDLTGSLLFSLLFIIVLINSSLRINKFMGHNRKFVISVLIEITFIMYMQCAFSYMSFILFYIIAVDAFMNLELSEAIICSLSIYICIMIGYFLVNKNTTIVDAFVNGAINAGVMIFFAGASYMARLESMRSKEVQKLNNELKSSRDELEEANYKLSEYARKIEDITVLNERNRMAGEIHDTIGHSLTALIMEIDICQKLIDKDMEKTRAELKKASDLARNALAEVRKSVRAIKPQNFENSTGIRAIEELIREFQKNTNIFVKFNISRNQYKLSPTVEVTIYRTIQEALTNCAKYGRVDIMTVDLKFMDGRLELVISDNGSGCRELTKGVGLRTMEERVHTLGGNIRFSGRDGFNIHVTIPVEV